MKPSSRGRSLALAAALALCGGCHAQSRQPAQDAAEEPGIRARVQRWTADHRTVVSYRWSDPNTLRVLDFSGDTMIVDSSVEAKSLEHKVEIDRHRLQDVIDSFGAPESWLTIQFRNQRERRQREAEQRQRLEARGFAHDAASGAFVVDHAWVIRNSSADVRPVTVGLRELAVRNGYQDARGLHGVIASFVQGMRYRLPPERRRLSDGTEVRTGGVIMPLETLYLAEGDCDTFSLLFASLLSNLQRTSVVFLIGNDHVFVGIRGAPRQHDRYVKLQGVTYVLVELTSAMPIGLVPDVEWRKVQRNLFRVRRIL